MQRGQLTRTPQFTSAIVILLRFYCNKKILRGTTFRKISGKIRKIATQVQIRILYKTSKGLAVCLVFTGVKSGLSREIFSLHGYPDAAPDFVCTGIPT